MLTAAPSPQTPIHPARAYIIVDAIGAGPERALPGHSVPVAQCRSPRQRPGATPKRFVKACVKVL